jgi:hypothetical protein
MIKTVFPVNVLIKDLEKSDNFSSELSACIQAIFQQQLNEKGLTRNDLRDKEFPVFTDENLEKFPVLKELRTIFADGFFELSSSFEENVLTKDLIVKMVSTNVGKLPFMKTGDYQRLHTHTSSIAFGIFYLSNVDNDKHGGKLILKDPSFHGNSSFHPPEDYEIETRKNRLVIAPAYVWHEVTPYSGVEDRITIVMNLHWDTVNPNETGYNTV